MTGLIWFVQIVHYPLFSVVSSAFPDYEIAHTKRTTWVVAPAMLTELATGALLALEPPAFLGRPGSWTNLALIGFIWISTFAWQVPQHTTLARGFSIEAHRRLVETNWIRTAAWSVRAVLLLACSAGG